MIKWGSFQEGNQAWSWTRLQWPNSPLEEQLSNHIFHMPAVNAFTSPILHSQSIPLPYFTKWTWLSPETTIHPYINCRTFKAWPVLVNFQNHLFFLFHHFILLFTLFLFFLFLIFFFFFYFYFFSLPSFSFIFLLYLHISLFTSTLSSTES